MSPTIWIVTGPPGAGKSSLCQALASRMERAVLVPMDELRLWVVSGLHESVPWTDETERQFQIAEDAACDVALRYLEGGFHVLLDHCRNLPRWEALADSRLTGRPVRYLCLIPPLELNLERNASRTNKDFDPRILDDTIRFTHAKFLEQRSPRWEILDPSDQTPEELAKAILSHGGNPQNP